MVSKRKLARNSVLPLIKTTLALGTITRVTTKADRMKDFVVNVDQVLTSNPMPLSNFKLLSKFKPLKTT